MIIDEIQKVERKTIRSRARSINVIVCIVTTFTTRLVLIYFDHNHS